MASPHTRDFNTLPRLYAARIGPYAVQLIASISQRGIRKAIAHTLGAVVLTLKATARAFGFEIVKLRFTRIVSGPLEFVSAV
jgi:hypothetical protein